MRERQARVDRVRDTPGPKGHRQQSTIIVTVIDVNKQSPRPLKSGEITLPGTSSPCFPFRAVEKTPVVNCAVAKTTL